MFTPCMRIYRQGFTFRWQRGDETMTVQLGNYRDGTLAGVIDRVPVPADGWVDVSDVRRRANAWLAKAAQPSPKTAAGVGASPTPASAAPGHDEVSHADQ